MIANKPGGIACAKDRLVVALDYPDRDSALRLVERLSGMVGMFKIGSQLFTAEGPQLVREIVRSGERVFLDLKFHDIPNTVAGASRSAARLGVSIFNVHTLGGAEMMRAASGAAAEFAAQNKEDFLISAATEGSPDSSRPVVLGVTVLTSMDSADLADVGISSDVDSEVVRLASLARDSGLDGVVASPREIRLIRERVAADGFIILTPGIRPVWSAVGDQKRIATPARAISDGADLIVIGRAITEDPEPRAAVERILEEIQV
ncbi:MAG: orotidine-5'-phosphate decarboxylase [Blastocatellia bacterium]|nr:orotidine-5'-phosphate decarboxylase [Blastocatellia bacterium]